MKTPEDAKRWARQRLSTRKRDWFDGKGIWPSSLSLDRPTRATVQKDIAAVKAWSAKWREWIDRRKAEDPIVEFEDVTWPGIGQQTFAARLSFDNPMVLAQFVGEGTSWGLATARRAKLVEAWPQLDSRGLGRFFSELAAESDDDFERLLRLLAWLVANPSSGHYVRQLPVHGVDTKWIEGRRSLVAQLFQSINTPGVPSEHAHMTVVEAEDDLQDSDSPEAQPGSSAELSAAVSSSEGLAEIVDFYSICGLRKAPALMKIAVLCPYLRAAVGGLRDFESPVADIARLPIEPVGILIVENLETAYSLEDALGVVAVVKMGNAVSLLSQVAWTYKRPVLYWGDIDTYGFSILALARKVLESKGAVVTSALMDKTTLEAHRHLIVSEGKQHTRVDPIWLRGAELEVYGGLLDHRWGRSVRIEQERLPWAFASAAIKGWHASLVPGAASDSD